MPWSPPTRLIVFVAVLALPLASALKTESTRTGDHRISSIRRTSGVGTRTAPTLASNSPSSAATTTPTALLASNGPSSAATTTPTGLILLCCLLAFATDSNNAMSGSFFATHFVERGVSTASLGLVLGVSSGAGLLMAAPMTPRLIRGFGATRTMLCSALVYAACRFGLASLHAVRDPRQLVVGATLALTVQAFADATCDVAASTTVLTSVRKEERTQAQGSFLALRSLGSLIAPPLGGWLYVTGGFALPFVFFGALLVLACLPVLRAVLGAPPSTPEVPKAQDTRSILRLWRVRRVMICMTAMAACLPFPASYWSPFLKAPPYGLDEAAIGVAMMLATVLFTGASVGSGALERAVGGVSMLALGTSLASIGFFLTSSLWPFTMLPQRVVVPVVGMCILYGAIGLVFAAASPLCVKLAEHEGMSAEAAASQVTSLWILAFAIAGSAAPPLGGWVAQRAGPRAAQTVAGGLALLATAPLLGLTVS